MLSTEFVSMLCCPEDHTPLAAADTSLLARINAAVAAGNLKNRAGQIVARQLDGALIRQDDKVAYPIIDGIPILLVDDGIWLSEA